MFLQMSITKTVVGLNGREKKRPLALMGQNVRGWEKTSVIVSKNGRALIIFLFS